jgi:hypothetical protein
MTTDLNDQRKELKDAAQQVPVEAVRNMEDVLKKFFEPDGVPYNAETLKASLQMCFLIHPNLPPMYSEFVGSCILILLRLIEEQESGLVGSPIQM